MDWKEKHLFLYQTTSELKELSTAAYKYLKQSFIQSVQVVEKLQLFIIFEQVYARGMRMTH